MCKHAYTIPLDIRMHVHTELINGKSIDDIADETGYTPQVVWLILNTFDDTAVSLEDKMHEIISRLNDPQVTLTTVAYNMSVDIETIENINAGTHALCKSYDDVHYPIQLSPHMTNEMLANIYFDIINSNMSLKEIAHKYVVSYKTIRHISAGTMWYNKHLQYPLSTNRNENLEVLDSEGCNILYLTDTVNHKIPTLKKTTKEHHKKQEEASKRLASDLRSGKAKPISGAPGYYICDNGDLITCNYGGSADDFGQLHNAYLKKTQYEGDSVRILMVNGKRKRCDVVVATEFIPNPNDYKYVTHLNGDAKDCRVENLAWSPIRDKNGKRPEKSSNKVSYTPVNALSVPAQPLNPFDVNTLSEMNSKLIAFIDDGIKNGTVKQIDSAGIYYVDINGNVYSKKELTGDVVSVMTLNATIDDTGTETITINDDVRSNHSIAVYRLVAKSFLDGYDENHSIVHHKNHCRFDNRVSNLVWVSASENQGERILFHRSLNSEMIKNGIDLSQMQTIGDKRDELIKLIKANKKASSIGHVKINIDNYLTEQKPFYGCVYLISQIIDGKKRPMYVGQTRRTPSSRLTQHLYRADYQVNKGGSGKEGISLLHYALIAYPLSDFELSVLECNIKDTELTARETYWINRMKTSVYDGGYNEYHDDYGAYNTDSFSRITKSQLNEITHLLVGGEHEFGEIADMCGTTKSYVTHINNGEIFYDCTFAGKYPLYKKSAIFNDAMNGEKMFLGIIDLLQENVMPTKDIATKMGISKPTVDAINIGKKCYDGLYEKHSIDVPIRAGRVMTVHQYCQLLIDYAKSSDDFETLFTKHFGRHVSAVKNLNSGMTIAYDKLRYPLNRNETYNKQVIRDDGYIIYKSGLSFSSKKEQRRRMYNIGNEKFMNGDK